MKSFVSKSCILLFLVWATSGCSIRQFAVNKVADTLSQGGSVYESDDDIELVGEALPFGLKLMESLLAEALQHRGLLQTLCQGFTIYSYLHVQYQADLAEGVDLAKYVELRSRSRKLYLRAFRYGIRGLEVSYPGIGERLLTDAEAALSVTEEEDVALLYWTAAALGSAISVSKDDASMLARLPEVEAILNRALILDESWNEGALHEFLVTLAAAKSGPTDYERIRGSYERALELSDGKHAGLYVAYAEAAPVAQQNRAEFRRLLEKALDVDTDEFEEVRLANLVAQRRARWLLERIDGLFLTPENGLTQK